MVKPEFLEEVTKPGFQFCRSAECDVVYFHPDGERLTKADVRVRVGLKETENPVPICYCFGFTEAMALKEIESSGGCTIPERITAEMKAERCACEVRNPQGSCCLGNITTVIKRLLDAKGRFFDLKLVMLNTDVSGGSNDLLPRTSEEKGAEQYAG
jgi:hypothetical protein